MTDSKGNPDFDGAIVDFESVATLFQQACAGQGFYVGVDVAKAVLQLFS